MLFTAALLAQLLTPAREQPEVLTLDAFLQQVVAAHPVSRQAALLEVEAAGNERAARGGMDPKATAGWERKRFGGAEYFEYLSAGLTVPTPLGVDVKLAFERTRGAYTAPDRRTPGGGLLTAGLSLPLGQRFLIDERRAAIEQARAMRAFAAADRQLLVNRLMASAMATYAAWHEAVRRVRLVDDAVRVARLRLEAVRQRVGQGESAAIDTLEASVEVQRREGQLVDARLAMNNTRLQVEAMLWRADAQPESLAAAATPEIAPVARWDSATVAGWLAAAASHPDVRKADARRDVEAVGRQVASQRLRVPNVTAQVARLADGAEPPGASGASAGAKTALDVESSLLLRRERGRLEASNAREEQAAQAAGLARRAVSLAASTAWNDLTALGAAITLQERVVAQARLLLDGEQRKFDLGESTLFLVTARERAVIDEQLRQIALEARRLEAVGRLRAAAGTFLAP